VWREILLWCGIHDKPPEGWANELSVDDWWSKIALGRGDDRKALASMIMLISWEILKEHNAHIFHHHQSSVATVIAKIKEWERSWCLAGAKILSYVILGEYAFAKVLGCVLGICPKNFKTSSLLMKMANLLPCFKKTTGTSIKTPQLKEMSH
jgi:hypothetical protein